MTHDDVERFYVGSPWGGLGSVLRFALGKAITHAVDGKWSVLGTWSVNIIGCFLIGLLIGWLMQHPSATHAQSLRLLLVVGVCGGFTTFSTFALESVQLIERKEVLFSVLYMVGSVVCGLIAVWAGAKLIAYFIY